MERKGNKREEREKGSKEKMKKRRRKRKSDEHESDRRAGKENRAGEAAQQHGGVARLKGRRGRASMGRT